MYRLAWARAEAKNSDARPLGHETVSITAFQGIAPHRVANSDQRYQVPAQPRLRDGLRRFHRGLKERLREEKCHDHWSRRAENRHDRIFTEDGASVPVTVIEVSPNRITQIGMPKGRLSRGPSYDR